MKCLFDIDGIAYEVELNLLETKELKYKNGTAKVTMKTIGSYPTEKETGNAFLRVEFDNGNVWASKDCVIAKQKEREIYVKEYQDFADIVYVNQPVMVVVKNGVAETRAYYDDEHWTDGYFNVDVKQPQYGFERLYHIIPLDRVPQAAQDLLIEEFHLTFKPAENVEDDYYDALVERLENGSLMVGKWAEDAETTCYVLIENYDALAKYKARMFGQKIARMRKARKLTQKQLADKSGLDQTYISRVESGSITVGMEVLTKIADALDTEIKLVKAPQ